MLCDAHLSLPPSQPSSPPLVPTTLQVFTTTEEEVWQHVAKEEVVEVTKEAYIPVEHQQQSSLLHLDSECVQVCVCVCARVCSCLYIPAYHH